MKTSTAILSLTAAALLMSGCAREEEGNADVIVHHQSVFRQDSPTARLVDLYTLKNAAGMEVAITTYGGRIVSLKAPGRGGQFADVVLGFDNLDGYSWQRTRISERLSAVTAIASPRANSSWMARPYKLAVNDGANSLHGGLKGFDKVVWAAPGSARRRPVRWNSPI